jgi:hypothetical protein
MSASTAVGKVSESIRSLLDGEMDINIKPKPTVTILAPDEDDGGCRVNLFLYKIQENPTLKNMDWEVKRGSPNKLVPPPLSLTLFYLMTAYSTNDTLNGNASAHAILGEAMRVFYENPIVPPLYLADEIKDAKEQVKIMLNTLDLEELSKIWSTFTKAFRLSVLYEVSVVQLDMLPRNERVMAPPVRKIGVPEVRVPYHPPVLEGIEPAGGTAGSRVTIYGKHLSGWRAYVYVTGKIVTETQKLAGDTFNIDLPGDLLPGFYEICVDISHLCRSTFIFEVTA